MKKIQFLSSTAVSLVALVLGAQSNVYAESSLNLEGLYMTRSVGDGVAYIFNDGTGTFDPSDDYIALKSDDIDFDFEAGVRGTFNFNRSGDSYFQLGGFWLDEHSDQAITSRSHLTVEEPFEPAWETSETCFYSGTTNSCEGTDSDFTDAYISTLDLSSNIWGVEGNVVKDLQARGALNPSLIFGLRYIDFSEDLLMASYDGPNDFEGTDDDIGEVAIEAENKLFGVQAGLNLGWDLGTRSHLNLLTKGGVFLNFAEQETRFSEISNDFTALKGEEESDLAVVLETGVNLDIAMTDRVSFGLGYNLLYLGGVALSTDQFPRLQSFDALAGLNNDGSVFYHGLNAGLTIAFGPVEEGGSLSFDGSSAILPANGSVSGNVLYMSRNTPDNIVFSVLEGSSPTPEVDDAIALSSDDFDFDYEPGLKVELSLPLSSGNQIALSGFWVDDHETSARTKIIEGEEPFEPAWETSDTGFCDSSVLICYGDSNFTDAYLHTADLSSSLKGVEANYVQTLSALGSMKPTLSLGLRYIDFSEDFKFTSYDEEDDYLDGDIHIGNYSIETENKLIGAQLGLGLDWAMGGSADVNLFGKGGVYANRAEQSSHFQDEFDDPVLSGESDETDLAMTFEAGAGINFSLSETVSLGLDYSMLYLNGVATAPGQFVRGQTNDSLEQLNRDDSVLYHGASARLKVSFN